MSISTPAAPRRLPGRFFLMLGLALAALGIIAYVAQIALRNLAVPWYMPCAATLGVFFVIASLWQARSLWRWSALVLVVLLAGFEWTFLLATRLPPYTGPAAEGKPFPAFETMRADGTPFTQSDLQGSQNNAFVFFRGRW